MKPITIITALTAVLIQTMPADAITYPSVLCTPPYPCATYNPDGSCKTCNCSGLTCPSGQTPTAVCTCQSTGGGGPSCPSACPSTTPTHSESGHYTVRCVKSGTLATCQYSCDKGYYSLNSLSGKCTSCATATGHSAATTATTGSFSITTCYIPAGTSFSDSTGSGVYDSNCYYQS